MHRKPRMINVLLSLILTVSILIGMSPVSAINVANSTDTVDKGSYDSDEFKVPDIIDEEEQAEESYIGRVKEEENDLYTFVFKNEDGSNTMRVFDHPVKYVDDKGETRDISLEISIDKDGSFKAADHMIKASFGNDLSEGINLEYDGVRIGMTAKTVSSEKESVELSSDGKKLTYAVDGKTSYVYSLTYCGIKEDIVVNEYTGQTEYEFTLDTNGLHPVKIDDSVFLADDEEIKASIGDIIIFTADNRNNAFGDLQFETVEENSEYKFTIILDPDYLRDERTAYPITIDPTVTYNYTGSIKDITLNSNDEEPNGSSGSIHCGYRDTYGISRIIMKFPDISFENIPSSSSIISAKVEIRDLMCQSDPLEISCYRFVGNVWDEATATWNTVGAYYMTPALSTNVISYSNGLNQTPSHRYSFDITSAVRTWYSSTVALNQGIIFKSNSENTLRYKTFASYNRATNKPSLTINYLPIVDGTYFVKNRHYSIYAQVDDNDAPGYTINGGIMEIWPFDGETYQQWVFTHVGNGYYKITSKISGYAITVPSGQETNDDIDLVLMPYAYLDRQRWSITLTSHGSYKIKAKSSESYTSKDLVMDLETGPSGDGLNVRQREYMNNTIYKDEWFLIKSSNTVQLEPQKQINWCWAASARMSSKIYMLSPVSQESAAVYVKLDIKINNPTSEQIAEANEPATVLETENALEFILDSDNVYSVWGRVYSETILRAMIDNNNPVIIMRGWYNSYNDRMGGHFVVIYGYHWDFENDLYVYDIYDPWSVNVGSSYSRSYQSICNGRTPAFATDMTDTGRWEGIVVYKTGFYNNTINWPHP